MRKQTKVVAVASAAALLAIGASMTSFAATGWVEEDGQWYFYDKDGNRVEDEWKKSGDNWYWMDSEEGGAMATDKLVEDDDNTYYVDSNGVMVKNTWVKVVNEDQDDDDDPAEYRYYYMQNSGKAYKAKDSGTTVFKTIDGKKYAFDEDGKMLYGWVNTDSTLATDDSDWETAEYYLGSWEDGSLKTGWQKVTVYDTEEDDDMDYWFNFKSNGKKRVSVEEKKINSKYYRFDDRGVMVYEWALASDGTTSPASISNWSYFNSPEDGARVTKGWFKVVAPADDNDNTFLDYGGTFAKGDSEDENERWYYANGDGELYAGQIKKIKGKYYGFHPEGTDKAGAMLTGLCALVVEDGTIKEVIAADMDSDDLDDCMDGKGDFAAMYGNPNASLYYFGSDEDTDGSMKTGTATVSIDGDSYNFMFSKSGGAEGKGKGLTGLDDGKYIYKFGMKMKAGSDDKYKIVYATGDTGDDSAIVEEIDSAKLRRMSEEAVNKNKDGDTIKYTGTLNSDFYLVNTSGSVIKNKTAAKDGDDWYFYVDEKQIKMYTNNKTLTADTKKPAPADENGNVLKDAWDKTDVSINNGNTIGLDDIIDR
ncbi:argininosuccinate lyase [Clostridium sp. AN503]|uniref:argininosuccinate lyase n=1 Tax=Clostridium sp. AN503 TaxID=3160598 RepID=UPI00345A829E